MEQPELPPSALALARRTANFRITSQLRMRSVSITKEEAIALPIGTVLYHTGHTDRDGMPLKARVIGACKVWRTDTSDFSLPAQKEGASLFSDFYITRRNNRDWTTTWASGEEAREAAKRKVASLERRKNAWREEDVPKYCKILRTYRLSHEELHKFRKEVEQGFAYRTEKGRLKVNEILREAYLLEQKRIAIIDSVEQKYLKQIDEAESERESLDTQYNGIGAFQSLFTNDKSECLKQWRRAQKRYESLLESARNEWRLKIENIESRLDELNDPFIFDSIYNSVPWWEQSQMTVSQKQTRSGSSPILACACAWNLDGLRVAIEIRSAQLKKEEELDDLKARAASSSKESRKLADSVKKRIADQINIVSECPYCGKPLDLETAHADHIYPVSKGGHSHVRNMVYVCMSCNLIKKDLTLNQFIRKTGFDRDAIENRLDALGKDY